MKLKLLCIGKLKDKQLSALIAQYLEKVSYDVKLDIIELKDSNPEEEGKNLLEHIEKIKENKFIFVLSEEGKQFDSVSFSKKLNLLALDNRTIVFVIGGPFGLSNDVKKKTDLLISLSQMTFTHEMCRLFLLEQVYRAISIINNKKYHK